MRKWLCVLCAAIVLAGCASVESVKDARGQGVKRAFRQPYEAVYQAVLNAAAKRKLELVEQDRAAGRVVLSGPASLTSLGERIAVFVTRGDRVHRRRNGLQTGGWRAYVPSVTGPLSCSAISIRNSLPEDRSSDPADAVVQAMAPGEDTQPVHSR